MVLTDLTKGQRFTLGGKALELKSLSESGRIAIAYVLDENGKRVYKPDDLTGDDFQLEIFSDTRFNREHRTEADDLI